LTKELHILLTAMAGNLLLDLFGGSSEFNCFCQRS